MAVNREKLERLNFAEHLDNIWWGYDDEEFSLRTSHDQIYKSKLASVSRPADDLKTECFRAARLIRETVDGKIAVLFSGGVDSEVIVQSFSEQNIPIDIYIIRFMKPGNKSSLNSHDHYWATKFCTERNLDFKFLDIDIISWLDNAGFEKYAAPVKCMSAMIPIMFWAAEQIDDYIVIGDGELSLTRWNAIFLEPFGERWAYARWLSHTSHPGCPEFYRYTSELEASYLLDLGVEDWTEHASFVFKHTSIEKIKPYILQKHFGTRYRPKYHGFEYLMERIHDTRNYLKNKFKGADGFCSIDYRLAVNIKEGNEYDFEPSKLLPCDVKMSFDQNSKHMIWN